MPFYTYRCVVCDAEFFALRKMDERDEPQPCPYCKLQVSKRQLDAPMVNLEGHKAAP